VVLSEEVEVFGFDDGHRPYRRPGQAVAVTVTDNTNSNANKGGILGFFSKMFSGSSSSSGYRQPPTFAPGDVVLCQPVEGFACQPMETVACQPVEGIACQPMTLQGP
jgi:hypothetical protein